MPVLSAVRADLVRGLKASPSKDARQRRFHPLLISEVALSLVLLVFAGVTFRSSLALDRAPLGFDPEGAVDFWMTPSRTKYPGPDERRQFYQAIQERMEAFPGIDSFGFTHQFPHQAWTTRHVLDVDVASGPQPTADVRSVDAGYFETLRIALVRGRHFDGRDTQSARPVAIVNEHLAERLWPGRDPIGKVLPLRIDEDEAVSLTVVGIVRNTHVPLVAEIRPIAYRPWPQAPPAWIDLVVRSDAFSEEMAESIRRAIWEVDPDPFISTYVMDDGPARWFARTRFAARLLGVFSLLAFVLSAAGVFAIVSFQLRQRRREMGIRKAVGARDRDLKGLLLARTLRQTFYGLGLGVVAAWAVTGYARGLLYGVEPLDTASTLSAAMALTAAAVLASYLPARRISRIHPSEALRSE